jgi:membrane protein DedA with SNARE-associated domain
VDSFLLALLAPFGPFALVLLMALAFAETGLLAGFLLPADTLLVGAGILVAAGALPIPVWLTLAAVTLAAAGGDQVAYLVGRRLGPRLQRGRRPRVVTPQRLDAAHALFERHGAKAVVLSRFVPLARTLTPVLAGVAGMDRRRFFGLNLAGAAAWALLMFGGGYWLGAVPVVSEHLELILLATVVVSVMPGVAAFLRERATARVNPVVPRATSTGSA